MIPHEEKTKIWTRFLEFIDSIEVGKKFARKNLLYSIYGINEKAFVFKQKSVTTVDNYRAILTKCGILEVTENSRGVYKKVMNVPKNLSYSVAVKMAYDSSWKQWFMTFEDKVKHYGGRGEEA